MAIVVENRLKSGKALFRRLEVGVGMAGRTLVVEAKKLLATATRTGRLYNVPGAPGARSRARTNSTGMPVLYGKKRSGRMRRKYRASAPGEPPANRTGGIPKNMRASRGYREGARAIVDIGVNVHAGARKFNYAKYHEYHNGRSYLRRAWNVPSVRRRVIGQIVAAIKSK